MGNRSHGNPLLLLETLSLGCRKLLPIKASSQSLRNRQSVKKPNFVCVRSCLSSYQLRVRHGVRDWEIAPLIRLVSSGVGQHLVHHQEYVLFEGDRIGHGGYCPLGVPPWVVEGSRVVSVPSGIPPSEI